MVRLTGLKPPHFSSGSNQEPELRYLSWSFCIRWFEMIYRCFFYWCTIVYLTFLCKSMRVQVLHIPHYYFQSPDWSTNQKLGNIYMVYRDTVTLFKEQSNFLFFTPGKKRDGKSFDKINRNANIYFNKKKNHELYTPFNKHEGCIMKLLTCTKLWNAHKSISRTTPLNHGLW